MLQWGNLAPPNCRLGGGIYVLDILGRFLDLKNIGIYRDDGLFSIPNSNEPLTSKIQK